jgi:hypothetical protein
MKKIIIELTDEQYKKMTAHQERGAELNGASDSFSGCGIKLCCTPISNWLEIDMYDVLDLGEVNWRIE